MKKYGLLFLVLCLGVTMLSGCDWLTSSMVEIDVLPYESETENETPDQTTDTVSDVDIENLVTDAYCETIYYDVDWIEDTVVADYAVPQINLDSDEIVALNEDIYDTYYGLVEESLFYYEESEHSNYTNRGICYEWAVDGDVLSLMITNLGDPNFYGTYYQALNISVSEQRELTTEEMMEIAGVDREQIKTALGSAYFDDSEWLYADGNVDREDSQYENTVADSNIDSVELYRNADGDIYVIGWVYSNVGADKYEHAVNMTQQTINDLYLAYTA